MKEAPIPESRKYNAEYYDAFEWSLDDVNFYCQFVSENSEVLELGCGTGRVSLPLSKKCKSLTGVEIAKPMLERAQAKDVDSSVEFVFGDMTSLDLKKTFDLIIAPYRVLQCLEEKEQVSGLFDVIRKHLKEDGLAILNVFNPSLSKEDMKDKWTTPGEKFNGEVQLENGDLLKIWDTRHRIDTENQVLHPEIIYRRYKGKELVDHHVNPICMRYYYPDEFKELIQGEGFEIVDLWGGYLGEEYGEGSELVVSFK